MTAAPSMIEVLAGALRAQGLTDEPEKFDSDIHGWRCSHPDIYGRCDCFAETVRDLAQALTAAGFGHVASVEREALYAARDALYRGEGPDFAQDADVVYGDWLGNRADTLDGEGGR